MARKNNQEKRTDAARPVIVTVPSNPKADLDASDLEMFGGTVQLDGTEAKVVTRIAAEGIAPQDELLDTDIANAKRLAARHGHDLRFTTGAGWLVYTGARWERDDREVRVQALAKETALSIFDEIKIARDRDAMMRHAKKSQQSAAITAMIHLARSEPGVYADINAFDADPMVLNVQNGTLDLRTGDLRRHRREDLITRMVPIAFDASMVCPLWESFLRRITDGDAELYNYIWRAVGYLLTGSTAEQVLHFLYGLGENGKSVFCEIIRELIGEYAIVASPQLIMERKHAGIGNDVARLRGIRVALMNETSQGSSFDEAKLKDLTGTDALTGRFLYAESFDFPPTHKLIVRGNHKPAITGTDEGIWRRLRLVPFSVQIPKADQDKHLIEKLRDELPGILAWAIRGCTAWQRDGLMPPAVILDAVQTYRAESDTLGRFIDEHCEQRKLGQVKSSVFFSRYQQYAEQAGERWMAAKELPHEMKRRGFEWRRTMDGRLFLGIELRIEPHWSGNDAT